MNISINLFVRLKLINVLQRQRYRHLKKLTINTGMTCMLTED